MYRNAGLVVPRTRVACGRERGAVLGDDAVEPVFLASVAEEVRGRVQKQADPVAGVLDTGTIRNRPADGSGDVDAAPAVFTHFRELNVRGRSRRMNSVPPITPDAT